jgi:uncharacterized 2Fe-2S/4Fe-4S cluster protein (DUF4445 family)
VRESGKMLLDALLNQGEEISHPCNGRHTCGKCKVIILQGNVSEMSEEERGYLTEEEIARGIRLACMTTLKGKAEVEIPFQETTSNILSEGYLPAFEMQQKNGYGIAVDIGTTTVVLSLVDLENGKELAVETQTNPQTRYGMDVLTRITYEYEETEYAIKKLQTLIVDALNESIQKVCQKSSVAREEITEMVIAANCTMMHMFLGIDARGIGRAPYQPQFLDAQTFRASELGIQAGTHTICYCLPQVSAYVGADIVAGVYVCELTKKLRNVLFLDIGTNGELVLWSKGRLYATACAAGPALEGMNIQCGMRAMSGAVEGIRIEKEGVVLQTIGNEAARGICGSGILSIVTELLRTNILKKQGNFVTKEEFDTLDLSPRILRMNGGKREFVLQENPELFVTQKDIRQVQLAKGAIWSGCLALLQYAEISIEELEQVIIAGQFGAHLSVDSLIGSGILPEILRDKITYVGNSSKMGAYLTLLSNEAKRQMEELAAQMEYFELGQTKDYERLFAKCMVFPGEIEKMK